MNFEAGIIQISPRFFARIRLIIKLYIETEENPGH